MIKITSLLASLPLITTACGGGGSDSSSTSSTSPAASVDLSQLKGIWSTTETQSYTNASGKTTTLQAPTALVSSREQMIILTGNSELYVIEPNSNTAHYFLSFAYSTEITPTSSLNSNNFDFEFYNPKRDADGQVSLPSDGHYDSAINLNNLAGSWIDDYSSTNPWTFVINTDGSFTADRDTGTCEASGNFTNIDITKSELAITITFTGSCLPLEDTHTGLAWTSAVAPGSILNVAVYNGLDGTAKGRGWRLNKQ